MLKKVLLMIVVVLSLVGFARAGPENGLTTWLMGDYNQTGVRVGYAWDTFELGLQSYWWLWEDVDPPQTYGLYGLYEFPGEIDINDIPVLSPLAPYISMASYVGFQACIEIDGNEDERGYYGPVAGIALTKFIFDEVDDQIITGTEIQWVRYTDQWEKAIGTEEEFRVTFFMRIKL